MMRWGQESPLGLPFPTHASPKGLRQSFEKPSSFKYTAKAFLSGLWKGLLSSSQMHRKEIELPILGLKLSSGCLLRTGV